MKKQVQKRNKTLRFRVKKALEKRKNVKHFTPTVEQCQSWFRTLNRGMFGGNLTEPTLIVRRMLNDWGLCIADWDNRKCRKGTFNQRVIPYHVPIDYRIELHNKFPRWKDFIETLAHEMIHLYQMQVWKDPYSNHNSNFYSWKNYFKQHNLRLYQ
jgi:hypothetical protein